MGKLKLKVKYQKIILNILAIILFLIFVVSTYKIVTSFIVIRKI